MSRSCFCKVLSTEVFKSRGTGQSTKMSLHSTRASALLAWVSVPSLFVAVLRDGIAPRIALQLRLCWQCFQTLDHFCRPLLDPFSFACIFLKSWCPELDTVFQVNSLKLDDPLSALSQLQDCSTFIKIIGKIQGTDEGQAVLQQSLQERVAYVVGFLEKLCKHKSTKQNLVSEEKLLAAEELELAKVVTLLLYYASMSDKIPREWATVEHDLQTEMAKFLNFMLYNEDCLDENLESFLQKEMPPSPSLSSARTEEATPPKREVHFLSLQKIASSSGLNTLPPGASASPVGDVMQTPQFQVRRLKKLLEAERENRDDLERELAEARKLLDEKDTRILVMKQRIDRLTLLQERQAADQLEPKELEELREKNESLLMRLHETLKQCQDLKTDKGQMDRKISQLSEENGDLAFRLREFSRTLTELQEAMTELSGEHSTALSAWEEQRSCLESELRGALSEKRGLEENLEILQGKISLLEDQLATLKESCALPEKGEVIGDVLKLEGLTQQVAHLSSKQAELQATVLQLEEEKRSLEGSLQSERGSFEAEKLQLTGLLADLQHSASEASRAKEKLEQDLQAQAERWTAEIATLTGFLRQKDEELLALQQQVEAERGQRGQLAEDARKSGQESAAALAELRHQVDQLSERLKQSDEKLLQAEAAGRDERRKAAREAEAALRQLKDKEAELCAQAERLRVLEQAQSASAAEAQREKAELSQKVQELGARVAALTAQCQQSEAQLGAVPALKAQLREAQQKLADKEKLSRENSRLQERLLVLEESVRNTEGILEDEKRRAAESLEGNLRRIAELEEQLQELTRHREQAEQALGEEGAKRQALEGQVRQLEEESQAKVEELQRQLAELSASAAQEDPRECGRLEEKIRALSREQEQTLQKLQAEQEKVADLEGRLKRLSAEHREASAELQAGTTRALSQVREKEAVEETLRAEIAALQKAVAVARQEVAQGEARAAKDGREAARALEAAARDLAEEKRKVAALEARVKEQGERSHEELAAAESSLSGLRSALEERQREAEQLAGRVASLEAQLEEASQQHRRELALRDEEARRLAGEQERARAELAAEKAGRAALEVQLQNASNEHRVEVSGLQEEVARAQELAGEKERELEELRLKNVSRSEELRDLQKTVSKLKGELASVEALKEREAKMESELQGFLEVARTQEAEMDSIRSMVHAKDLSLKSLQEENRHREQECASSRELCERRQQECEALRGQLGRLERQCKEQQGAVAKLEKGAAAAEQQQRAELEVLRREAAQHRQRVSELEALRGASEAAQGTAVEQLRRELAEQGEELARSRAAASSAEKELAALRASAQEKGKAEESWKEQMARCLQEGERKAGLIGSLEQEMAIMHRQLLEKEAESKDLRRLVLAESEKSKKLEERLRLLQSEMATAASRAAERCSAMKVEAQSAQEQAEKLRASAEALRKEVGALSKREEGLREELKTWQEKVFQKEQLLSAREQELSGAQATVAELLPAQRLCQQLQAEQAAQERRHREAVEQLQAELARARLELPELLSAKERCLQQERTVQQLRAENSGHAEQLATLQRAHAQLTEEHRALGESSGHGLQRLGAELAQAKQKHAQELEAARLDSEKRLALSKQEAEEARRRLEAVTAKHEEARQQLLVQSAAACPLLPLLLPPPPPILQVEQLEACQKQHAKQVDELKQKLARQDKAGQGQQQRAEAREKALLADIERLNEKTAELQGQLAEKEQAAEHYKAQVPVEKARTHYDAKKQHNQELLQKVKHLEQLEEENAGLRAESERLAKELQHVVLQAKESELNCKSLSSRVRTLEAQVQFADRQLRGQGKPQAATDILKRRETFRQGSADISSDSLDLSTGDETQLLSSTGRRTRRSLSESGASESSKAPHELPHKVESLESLCFTPIPTRARSKLEGSLSAVGDVSFESGRKSLSGRRRTTQVVHITMTKKQAEPDTPYSASEPFSLQPAGSQASAPSQESVKTRLRSAASSSTRSLASLPSQESLARLGASSPSDAAANAALMNLPGYRPATRSSMRRSQAGGASTGRRSSSFYVGTCHEEPEQLDDWNRIAELQQRNRACPPHLKTCYPLESRPSQSLTTITDEEMMTGDPRETLRRASLLPTQAPEGPLTRRSTLSAAWAGGGVATRQQRKRVSEASQLGPGTPESKKAASCFPRPQTPKGRTEEGKHSAHAAGKKGKAQAPGKQSERRQSLAFSILNTPKKLGSSLLRRGASRKATPRNSPRGSSRRSPRAAASPQSKVGLRAGQPAERRPSRTGHCAHFPSRAAWDARRRAP
ncbi:Nuclear mitotic apparatus protein 1 [Varanus komodoensis]|nr:Nuclear mitotic apparatus protein 1 [Varanus komodoensis]